MYTGNFWMQLNMRLRNSGPTGYGILRYELPSTEDAEPLSSDPAYPGRLDVDWSMRQARRQRSLRRVKLPAPTRVITMLGTQNRLAEDGRLVWALNNISFIEQPTPLLHSVKLEINEETDKFVSQEQIPTKYNYSLPPDDVVNGLTIFSEAGTQVIKVEKDEVVDFVFQNAASLNGAKEVHPWHLHLHNFWLLGYGERGVFWTEEDMESYRTRRAVSRNTLTLFPDSWTAIRVKFDNAGVAHFRKLSFFDFMSTLAKVAYCIQACLTKSDLHLTFCRSRASIT